MRVSILCSCAILAFLSAFSQSPKDVPTIYVDKQGVMRWSDSKQEASFYGANYTVPFAHAFRALSYKGINHKQAIDRDVYHLARLGFNAYRIHIWDVELSDAEGNLTSNEHLDLLDYLFAKLQEKGMRILITTMTNFGNGYPERNQQTGAFSYLYDKCAVHADPKAIEAQKRYVAQLLQHVNPYTGYAYQEDPSVIGFEINNEPCHTGEVKTTANYIKQMLAAMKKAGNKKPVFYNVSHNMEHVSAYFDADIQGTTYQWYPMGLVAGHTRRGNFLPYVDDYLIPFSTEKGFANKARAVYEYDPADNLYSVMHPAMSRTFRSAGFQWITQFAYDPMDIAAYNTEYQTHYLNLAYTPAKAISMMIAAEVAYTTPRNQRFPAYPQDTIFGDFMLSYTQDLALMNNPEKYYYSNDTKVKPVEAKRLQHIAGHGSSPVVCYSGTGAYFLDRLEDGLWRLELMPDVLQQHDPFAKPSLTREVMLIMHGEQDMRVELPDLGTQFTVQPVDSAATNVAVDGATFTVRPGVYLLKRANLTTRKRWTPQTPWNQGKLGEFYAPATSTLHTPVLTHTPAAVLEKGEAHRLTFKLMAAQKPDSVILQTDNISFWKDDNIYFKLQQLGAYDYSVALPADLLQGDVLRYTVTVFADGQRYTYPDNRPGEPLAWDYEVSQYWSSKLAEPTEPILLADGAEKESPFSRYAIPETAYSTAKLEQASYVEPAQWSYTLHGKDTAARYFWKKDIADVLLNRPKGLQQVDTLCVQLQGTTGALAVGMLTNSGYTYCSTVQADKAKMGVIRIALADLKLVPTALLPAPFPSFLPRYFQPQVDIPFRKTELEQLLIATTEPSSQGASLTIGAVWLE